MVELARTVRFCINPEPSGRGSGDNTFAAHPSMRGLGRFYEIRVTCRGRIDPQTGYFVNIKTIDQAVRSSAVPLIEAACRERPGDDPSIFLPPLLDAVNRALGGSVVRLCWNLTPYYSVEMAAKDTSTALLRQQFEFAASHRLHTPGLSDAENRALYGKCNHPSGHGHNYRVEPCVAVRIPGAGERPGFSLADLERLTNRTIIERYDHRHLNVDTPEFSCEPGSGGVNPSVENIARICFERLAPVIAEAAPNGSARLRSITVWETDKTSCTFPAEPA